MNQFNFLVIADLRQHSHRFDQLRRHRSVGIEKIIRPAGHPPVADDQQQDKSVVIMQDGPRLDWDGGLIPLSQADDDLRPAAALLVDGAYSLAKMRTFAPMIPIRQDGTMWYVMFGTDPLAHSLLAVMMLITEES